MESQIYGIQMKSLCKFAELFILSGQGVSALTFQRKGNVREQNVQELTLLGPSWLAQPYQKQQKIFLSQEKKRQNRIHQENQSCYEFLTTGSDCKNRENCQKTHKSSSDLEATVTQENSRDIFISRIGPPKPVTTQEEEKKDQDSGKTVLNSKKKKTNENLSILIQQLKIQKNVDVLLLLDCTSSMGRWIEEAKKNMITIIQQLKQKSSDFSFRVGFVGYRDFGDKEQLVDPPFTNDLNKIVELISKQRAVGGGDEAEDLIGALNKSLQFNFDKRHSLHCFLICDAPCHGKQYHTDEITDNHSNVLPGTLENLMKQIGSATQLVKFTCFQITEYTNIMFQKMSESFKDLEITKHCKPEEFQKIMVDSLQTTILHTTKLHTQQMKQQLQQQPSQHISTCIGVPQSDYSGAAELITFSFPKICQKPTTSYWKKRFCDRLKEKKQEVRLKIKKHHFNEGIENFVYDVQIEGSKMEFVAKIPKDREENDAVQEEKAKEMMISSAYAYQLTKHFTQDTYDIPDAPMLFYIPPMRIVLKDNYGHLKHLYLEPKLKNSENYVKVSNNFDTCQKWTFASFSHYTYAITQGYLMVTDLQGVGSILTDPAIQSEDRKRFSGKSNLGLSGQVEFFVSQHPKCNQQICSKLKLSRPDDTDQQSSIMSNPEPNLIIQETFGVCGFCFSQGIVNVKQYRQMQKKSFGFHYSCEECRIKLKEKLVAKCQWCQSDYEYNKLIFETFHKKPKYCISCEKLREQQKSLKIQQDKLKKEGEKLKNQLNGRKQDQKKPKKQERLRKQYESGEKEQEGLKKEQENIQ